jgi:hypothetical protein
VDLSDVKKGDKQDNNVATGTKEDPNTTNTTRAQQQGDLVSSENWSWPKGTYFQRRLKEVRRQMEEATGETSAEVTELEVAVREALAEDVAVSEQAAQSISIAVKEPPQAVAGHNSPAKSLEQDAAPEARAAANVNSRQARTSPTQALLAMERNEWVRTGVNSSEPVDMGTGGLARAPRKGNLDRFRFALINSGEWTRSEPNTALTLTANGAAEQSAPPQKQKPAVVEMPEPPQVTQPPITQQVKRQVTPPSQPKRATESLRPQVHTPLLASENPWQLIDRQFNQASAAGPDWAEIEEKFLWLSNPSS